MKSRSDYTVRIKLSAEKEMDRLSAKVFDRISAVIMRLEADPRPRGCRKLRGVEEYRVQVGPYRILYLIDDSQRVVEVVAVGHRRDVYRGI
ncbi:MAG: type II toxin-antitoxin system RelE/ParE family toxin [bacterium]